MLVLSVWRRIAPMQPTSASSNEHTAARTRRKWGERRHGKPIVASLPADGFPGPRDMVLETGHLGPSIQVDHDPPFCTCELGLIGQPSFRSCVPRLLQSPFQARIWRIFRVRHFTWVAPLDSLYSGYSRRGCFSKLVKRLRWAEKSSSFRMAREIPRLRCGARTSGEHLRLSISQVRIKSRSMTTEWAHRASNLSRFLGVLLATG